jgi:AraC-like DNA-binding protein
MNGEHIKIADYIESLKVDDIKLLACSRSGERSTWVLDKHSHPYFEFIYFFNAKARIDVPKGKLDLVPYDLIVYPPGVMHHELPDLRYPQEIICIAAYIDSPNTINTAFQISDTNGTLGWLFEQSFWEFVEKQEGYEEIIITYIKASIFYIHRSFKSNKIENIDILNASVRFIHEHFNEPLSVKQLASISCVSKSYLSRLFIKKLGVSPMRYLNTVRVDIAKKLLIDSKLSIGDIAAKVGFSDPLYFSRVFSKSTGLPPAKFRKIK